MCLSAGARPARSSSTARLTRHRPPLADGVDLHLRRPDRVPGPPRPAARRPARSARATDLATASAEMRHPRPGRHPRRPLGRPRGGRPVHRARPRLPRDPRRAGLDRDHRAPGCARASARARSSPSASGSPARCTTAWPRSSASPTSGCGRCARRPEVGGAAGRRPSSTTWPTSTEEAYRDVREAILGLRESSRVGARPDREPAGLPREVQPAVGRPGDARHRRSTTSRPSRRGPRSRSSGSSRRR